MAYWFGVTTPVELVSVSGATITLRDEAARHEVVRAGITEYRVEFLRGGRYGGRTLVVKPPTGKLEFVLPERALDAARDYLVVQITARRGNRALPRAFELHMKVSGGGPSYSACGISACACRTTPTSAQRVSARSFDPAPLAVRLSAFDLLVAHGARVPEEDDNAWLWLEA